MARTRPEPPQPRSTERKPYPANRKVNSVKKPPRPGMRAFNSRNGLQELAHQISHKPQSQETDAEKFVDFKQAATSSKTKIFTEEGYWPYFVPEQPHFDRLQPGDVEYVNLLMWKESMLRGSCLGEYELKLTKGFIEEELPYESIPNIQNILNIWMRFPIWAKLGRGATREERIQEWRDLQDFQNKEESTWLLSFFFKAEFHANLIGLSNLELKRRRHESFIGDCLTILKRARVGEGDNNVRLMELLQALEIPRLLWETGWKQYLDYLEEQGLTSEMEAFLQKAYMRIYELQQSMPEFSDFWETCRKGLDEYSRRLHDMRLKDRRDIPPMRDKCGRFTKEVDFVSEWARPISELGCKVLNGWSYVRNLVKRFVYVKVGFVFCEVDAW